MVFQVMGLLARGRRHTSEVRKLKFYPDNPVDLNQVISFPIQPEYLLHKITSSSKEMHIYLECTVWNPMLGTQVRVIKKIQIKIKLTH